MGDFEKTSQYGPDNATQMARLGYKTIHSRGFVGVGPMVMTQAMATVCAAMMVFGMISMLSLMQAWCDRDCPAGGGWN